MARPRRRPPTVAAALRRLIMPPDTRSRHQHVEALAGAPESLLDVGGSTKAAGLLMPHTRIVTANVVPGADVLFDGVLLPFADDEFDVVVSVDVIEHIERPLRASHIAELSRVARGRVIVCCPLGGEDHDAAERKLADWYEQTTGRRHQFLDEHIERGLPDEAELIQLARDSPLDADLLFGGNFEEANEIFRQTTILRRRPTPRGVLRFLRLALRPAPELPLERASTPLTNRAFLVGAPPGARGG